MRFILNTYLVRENIDQRIQQGARRYQTQQPIRYDWLRKKMISIKHLSRDKQNSMCQDYWGKTLLLKVWFVDFYVDIPKRFLDEWNSVHENKLILSGDAKENWDEIHRVKTRYGTKGLAEWLKTNVQDEYCNLSGRNYWGFKNEQDALFFGLTWR